MEKEYYKEKKINMIKYFDDIDICILKKLGINIENRLYSEYEYACIEEEVFLYNFGFENIMHKTDYKRNEILKLKKISKKQYHNILEKFNKISSIYNL